MSKPSLRKQRKQKARQQAGAKRKQLTDERRHYSQMFPSFVYRENGAPAPFVTLVKKAIQQIDFRDPRQFADWEIELFKRSKKYGCREIYKFLQQHKDDPLTGIKFLGKLGNQVFSMIPQEELLKWIPFHDVEIRPYGQNIIVSFRSLRAAKTPGGMVYYSRHRPTIVIDGQRKIVGFSDHAIRRICQRISPEWRTYVGLADAFAYFDQCVYFQRNDFPNGQLAFTFFDECRKGTFYWKYVKEILGEDIKDDGHYYHRAGYCPAVIEGDFIIGKTLLYPGYRNTPEYRLVWASDVPLEIKRQAEDMDVKRLIKSQDFRLFKFFHQRGIPQVIHDERDVFMCVN